MSSKKKHNYIQPENVSPEVTEEEVLNSVDNTAETEEIVPEDSKEDESNDVEETKAVEEPQAPVVENNNTNEKSESLLKGVVVNCIRLNVRKGPGKENLVVTTIPEGNVIVVKECDNPDWYKIPGKGYVMKKFIKLK